MHQNINVFTHNISVPWPSSGMLHYIALATILQNQSVIFNPSWVFRQSASCCAKTLLSGTSLCFIEHLLRSLFQNNKLTVWWWSRFHMSREWALYGQVGGKLSWCKCEVVPVISNRGSQWGSATDSYESGSAASNGAVLLFGNAYYKCHLSALPGTLPSLWHVNRAMLHATTALPPDASWRGVTQLSLHAPAVVLHGEPAQGD